MNSLWLIITSCCAFIAAYRFYGAFLAAKVAVLNDARSTPAHRLKDGVDYHPTSKLVLFGHHFAAIAGPGPLIGPVLAAQWGYLPGFAWIIIGACLAGAVHDFVIMWASVRENGRSLPNLARLANGALSGWIVSIATLFIIVISLAAVGKAVVVALGGSADLSGASHGGSPWGVFTILCTIPAALLTGLWMYKIRPGKVGEASAIGVSLVLLGVYFGNTFQESSYSHYLNFTQSQIALMLPCYALVASILPVWVLMCPRDYLSSYMKIGVMIALGLGLVIAHPELKMPATTPFLSDGPVVPGAVWPFICIVIMCGAISGFHSLIASGTTPKMVDQETHVLPLAYGAMVLEGFVAVTALIAACALEPGDYLAINMSKPGYAALAAKAKDGFIENLPVQTVQLTELEAGVKESLEAKPGGAVTLAVGMAKVFAELPGMKGLLSYWYHFVIMFEALFILTLLETGTRVARFVLQEMLLPLSDEELARIVAGGKRKPNWVFNAVTSVLACFAWGYLLYAAKFDVLWKILGVANQLLASIALAIGTSYLLLHAPKRRYALLTLVPFVFVVITVYAAGFMLVPQWFGAASKLEQSTPNSPDIFLFRLLGGLASAMLALVAVITVDSVRRWIQLVRAERPERPGSAASALPGHG